MLATYRMDALKLWPSLILLLIPIVETVTHLKVLSSVASGDANWWPQVSFANLPAYVMYGFGAFGAAGSHDRAWVALPAPR